MTAYSTVELPPGFDSFEVLSFDCYGTLIDWETGILSTIKSLLTAHSLDLDDRCILELYGQFEREAQGQSPFLNYRSVLQRIVTSYGTQLGFQPSPQERDLLVQSIANWQPFPDTVPALKQLKTRFKLAIISNVDDDLFQESERLLQVQFDWIITAQQTGCYKPDSEIFEQAFRTIGLPRYRHLHVAQSLYHDIAPTHAMGLKTVWVNREGARSTPAMDSPADLEVPDLRTLASIL